MSQYPQQPSGVPYFQPPAMYPQPPYQQGLPAPIPGGVRALAVTHLLCVAVLAIETLGSALYYGLFNPWLVLSVVISRLVWYSILCNLAVRAFRKVSSGDYSGYRSTRHIMALWVVFIFLFALLRSAFLNMQGVLVLNMYNPLGGLLVFMYFFTGFNPFKPFMHGNSDEDNVALSQTIFSVFPSGWIVLGLLILLIIMWCLMRSAQVRDYYRSRAPFPGFYGFYR
ncbi:MAG: hypothetical protein Q4P78_05655 [Rothia sp. (in: high G+C Gram-positive bacteria)]|uniref:hypothetical protein n=1 Tax=Rothia sp. (in: high G+C Gram-positive bacteria) TaxID=1885016 RepID=UPI0026DF359C|nr:hypothetical protein [Rothia sp. (in: high G+C Gram-positive bacteria)]MDO5750673.1 hypothetical protein [Rothia sp. (in: high G+C Gram-positive bacteria)]